MGKRAVAMVSGGKDSVYALYLAMQQGFEIEEILTVRPVKDSFMYHVPNIELVSLQAEAMGIKHRYITADDEVESIADILSNYRGMWLIAGAIASNYQRTRLEMACEDADLKTYFPLWWKDEITLLRDMINSGFHIRMVTVASEGLEEKHIWSVIDEGMLEFLISLNKKYGVNISGEGGEYETLVLDGPIFRKKIRIDKLEKYWTGMSGGAIVKKASLA